MEILQEIIRSIAVIIIFAGFMEMLLPDTEARRYIQLIVGLFVIVSLVTPFAKLVDKEKSFEVAAWHVPTDNTQELILKGQKIAQDQQTEITTQAEKRVAIQINALAKLHDGVKDAVVDVKNNEDNSVTVKIKLTTDETVSAEEKSELSEDISNTVTAFFDYPTENIEIGF